MYKNILSSYSLEAISSKLSKLVAALDPLGRSGVAHLNSKNPTERSSCVIVRDLDETEV